MSPKQFFKFYEENRAKIEKHLGEDVVFWRTNLMRRGNGHGTFYYIFSTRKTSEEFDRITGSAVNYEKWKEGSVWLLQQKSAFCFKTYAEGVKWINSLE